jgi:prepilin-type N-terminal cleavage/methylation domain-containing protein
MRRGFTLIEMAIVISILALLVPAIYVFHRDFEAQEQTALLSAEAARGMRSVSEELRRDLRTLRWSPDNAMVLLGTEGTACRLVRYEVTEDGVLLRNAGSECGGPRPVARGVSAIGREGAAVEVTFSRRVRGPDARTLTFRFAGGEVAR